MIWLGFFAAVLALGLLAGSIVAAHMAKRHPPAGEFRTVDGVKLHFREDGDPAGPPVLILHGASSNLEEPRLALRDALSGHRAIWLDRPGLGWSQRPAGDWSPQREAALIAGFMTELEVDRAVVIGHSWGGAIAARLAMDHPDRVEGLVLIAPALSAWIGEAAWFNKISHLPLIGWTMTRILAPLAGLGRMKPGAASAFHPEPLPDGYVEDSALGLMLRPSVWKANAADMARVNHHLEAQEARYQDIAAPVIFLAGKADTVLWTKRHSVMVSSRMAAAELRLIRGAGHNLHHHHPGAVASAVTDIRRRKLRPAVESAGGAA